MPPIIMPSHALHLAIILAACIGLCGGVARGQEADAKVPNWSKLEREIIREFKPPLRGGEPLDERARGFLVGAVMPQLAVEANRPTIERVRRRIREVVLTDIADERAFLDVAKTVLESASAMARNGDLEPVVRVNAMLLAGELDAKDGRPLPEAVPVLAASAGDVRMPLALRIAAASGLTRHAESAKVGGDVVAVSRGVASALAPMLAAPEGGPTPAVDWLAGSGLSILQMLGPPAATPESLAAAARILGDPTRAVDVRIRAAAALGSAATQDSGVDVRRAVEAVRSVAVAGLEADLLAAENRRLEFRMSGAAPAAAGPVNEPTVPSLVCRRAAWRLATAADAVAGPDGTTGLAQLLGGDAAPVAQLAAVMRAAAATLDARPVEASVVQAIGQIKAAGRSDGGAAKPAAAAPPADRPGT